MSDHNGNIACLTRKNCCQLFFVYGGAHGRMEGMGPMAFLQKSGIADRNIVFVRDPKAKFYHEGVSDELPDLDSVLDWHAQYIEDNPHITEVYTVGNSFGGWASMFFGYMLGVDKVWALAPAGPWGRDLLIDLMKDGNGHTEYDVYYSRDVEEDKIFAESFVGYPNLSLTHIDEHGHMMITGLINTGQLPTMFPPFKAAEGA
ncbi:hypothetical protein [Flavimaricola marinus]|uniref:Alpha/beta hydrolase family protein n=1 Tax=Flavimaricola marinus TaxID=1819565 RepID=A0A238LIN3_9RHOB|nr:hypothetical protein [Flavimaricola marinus]SMY09264.1 hypothetical protein LOM8899_03429 [Flavimaricola marinus]